MNLIENKKYKLLEIIEAIFKSSVVEYCEYNKIKIKYNKKIYFIETSIFSDNMFNRKVLLFDKDYNELEFYEVFLDFENDKVLVMEYGSY